MCDAKITLPPPLPSGAAAVAITTCCYLQEAEVRVWGVKVAREADSFLPVLMWPLRSRAAPWVEFDITVALCLEF